MQFIKKVTRTIDRGGFKYLLVKLFDGGLRPIGINIESYLYNHKSDQHFNEKNFLSLANKARFQAIFESNYWSSAESVSGTGSEVTYTSGYINEIEKYLRENDTRSFFDAPCGDVNWIMQKIENTDIKYMGGDIVEELIIRNRKSVPKYDFQVCDITSDNFPSADVWHCRDCLFHLSYADIRKALANFLRSDIQTALITTHKARAIKNRDIHTGYFRYTDLERAPFNFPKPVSYLKDYVVGKHFPRYVGAWKRHQVEQVLKNWCS